ncbi:Flp pilus assembly protein CpaB [Geomobilimonas luticola]|uniref:Flp pilus assembly protein CpaB n=1 Tax=Geomobilimonas luticola TaxID=1114878 RepID=A0ABS5SEM4_9BACT|nr:Flp pilus assembly protein CpaB [Geomobilimonas luticola]MBT0652964.1 Flp pilus assembly protein CpaB [Geomobilimonas luticola]
MLRYKSVLVVSVLALVFAGAAAWLTYNYLNKEKKKITAAQPENIVVAATEIPIGSQITANQVKIAAWAKESIPPGSMQEVNAAVGRVAIRHITPGDSITEQKLKPKAGAGGTGFMTYVVPQGHRAVTVAVNEVAGVGGFITPNDRVDVVLTTPIPGSPAENISKIVLQNVPVLATGQITEQKEGKPAIVPTVTLDLLPEDAEKLVLGSSKGTLQLLLRNIADIAPVESRGATISKVLTGSERPTTSKVSATPKPRKAVKQVSKAPSAPSPSYSVEIIKGKERTSKQFTE